MGLFDFLTKKKLHEGHGDRERKFASREDVGSNKEVHVIHSHAHKVSAASVEEEKKLVVLQRRKKEIREKAMSGKGMIKKDLGVCIPNHAKDNSGKRKSSKEDLSPFDLLRMDNEKKESEFNKEFDDITHQTPSEPYDYDPYLGVETVDSKPVQEELKKKPLINFNQSENKSSERTMLDRKGQESLLDRKAAVEREVRGVIASRAPFGESREAKEKSTWGKALPSFTKKEEVKQEKEFDEIDDSIEKVEDYVPRFSKTAREKFVADKTAPSAPKAYGQFAVTGSYPGGDTTIISGEVTSGKITKRMTTQKGSTNLRVDEIKRGSQTVNEIYEGETGTIFIRGTINTVKYGDVLEFS